MSPEHLASIEHWLTEQLPGGKWILPHWQDGPFWLVPVLATSDSPNWQAELILDAFTPVATHLPAHDGFRLTHVDVHAVPDFAKDILVWHQDEYGLQLALELMPDSYEQMPDAHGVLAALDELTGVADARFDPRRTEIDQALQALRAAGPAALAALSAVDPDAVDPDAGRLDDEDADTAVLVTLLRTAATIAAPAPTS